MASKCRQAHVVSDARHTAGDSPACQDHARRGPRPRGTLGSSTCCQRASPSKIQCHGQLVAAPLMVSVAGSPPRTPALGSAINWNYNGTPAAAELVVVALLVEAQVTHLVARVRGTMPPNEAIFVVSF